MPTVKFSKFIHEQQGAGTYDILVDGEWVGEISKLTAQEHGWSGPHLVTDYEVEFSLDDDSYTREFAVRDVARRGGVLPEGLNKAEFRGDTRAALRAAKSWVRATIMEASDARATVA